MTTTVPPRSGRRENLLVGGVVVLMLVVGGVAIAKRQVDYTEPRLLDWQISAFYDFNPTDQAIYNALVVASEELWWIHGDILYFGTEEEKKDPWPTVEALDKELGLPPFVKDMAWTQQGEVNWQRVASFSFEGSTVYHGAGGSVPGQSSYLLMLSHVHKGASYADGATFWVHADPNSPAPGTIKRDSLIINGWREVSPYSGEMEVERLNGA